MALGFLATNAHPEVLTLEVPAGVAPLLRDAVEHLPAAAPLATQLEAGGPLRGGREMLAELLASAIDEAGERVAAASARLLRERNGAAEVRARAGELEELLDMLDSLDA